jgi:hypothetical protein
MTQPTVPRAAARRLSGFILAGLLALASTSMVAADEPPTADPSLPLAADDLGLDGHASWADRVAEVPAAPAVPLVGPAVRAPQPTATPSPTPDPTPEPAPIGLDVSYPQCGDPLPDAFGFAIVGVNGGRVYKANPCFGPERGSSQLEWAGPEAELYLNTGNPGPRDSLHWPVGQDVPRSCDAADVDSLDCAYVYGWNAAHDAYARVLAAYVALGWADAGATTLPQQSAWWLDVEDANSWRRDDERNISALQGMVDALAALDIAEIGFYSTPRLWDRITGGTDHFAAYPAWHAGASDEADARRRCDEEEAFTGGDLRMVQWVEDRLDHNLRCDA